MNHQKTESKTSTEKLEMLKNAMTEMVEAIASLDRKAEIAVELFEALKAMVNMFDCVSAKITWEASFLDAEAIQKMNDAPIHARAAIERMENASPKN